MPMLTVDGVKQASADHFAWLGVEGGGGGCYQEFTCLLFWNKLH
jgi:hypothetical protein